MKKNICTFLIVVLVSVFFSGCLNVKNADVNNKIIAPNNEDIPIRGTWEVKNFKPIKENYDEEDKYLEITAQFSNEFASFGKDLYIQPYYKVKYVNINDYVVKQYKMDSNILDLKNTDNMSIIQITSGDKSMYDIIKVSDEEIIMCVQNGFLYLKKTSDETEKLKDDLNSTNKSKHDDKDNIRNEIDKKKISTSLPESGVLLGLKNKDSNGDISYRTLWISYDSSGLRPSYEINGLVIPRQNGFWDLVTSRHYDNGVYVDTMTAKSLNRDLKVPKNDNNNSEIPIKKQRNIAKEILFVTNNYIAIENRITDENNNFLNGYYRFLPIDNLNYSTGLKISDVLGERARDIFMASGKKAIEETYGVEFDESMLKENNFTIKRKNGNWNVVGKAQVRDEIMDFNVNLLLTKGILNYDDLYIPWNLIKSAIPDAIDAYTAPNNKFALIINEDNISVYNIKNNMLQPSPLSKIDIDPGEEVIMAEWATGSFIYKWDEDLNIKSRKLLK
ncbi:hypothetical protein [Clostridium cadaveris]|uniref:hypothetical protein n=1 Tax=Clostridium cadaveris TaxID=1529 RepID=UPI000C077826|nr:hypothetical protein [Clostridium cadaveris]